MKKLIAIQILAAMVALATTVKAQDYPDEYLGLPGDNLNLYAVMDLFQNSETLEVFERNLNDQNTRVNNLDLNSDNLIDYITVHDYVNGNVHTIVLRTALSRYENQDVAVFTVEKFRDGTAQIQLVGDEALYGRNYIIEPNYAETPNPGYSGSVKYKKNVAVVTTTYYEVAAWPLVRFIYMPTYVTWHSAWYWDYYPVWWNPWRPYYWHYYYGYHYNWHPYYYSYYRHCDYHRYREYNTWYYSNVRVYSPQIHARINEGQYKQTYSRPESRRDGEALYASDIKDPGRRRPSTVSTGYNDRRSAVTASTASGRSAESRPEESRRAPSSISERNSDRAATGQGNVAARRPVSSTAAGRTETRSATGQSGEVVRRTSPAANDKGTSKNLSGQYSEAVRRSGETVSRSTARPAEGRGNQAGSPAASERSVARPSAPSRSQSSGMAVRTPSQGSQSAANRPAPSRSSEQSASRPAPSRSSEQTASRPAPSRSSQQTASRPAPSRSSQQTASRPEPSQSRQPAARSSNQSGSSSGSRTSAPAAKSSSSNDSKENKSTGRR